MQIKLACLSNNIRLWREIVEADEPMMFIEHDALCHKWFDQRHGRGITMLSEKGLKLHRHPSKYQGSTVMFGTAAYVCTPLAAKQLLLSAKEDGLEQSDFIINDMVVDIKHRNLVKMQRNLNTSHTPLSLIHISEPTRPY